MTPNLVSCSQGFNKFEKKIIPGKLTIKKLCKFEYYSYFNNKDLGVIRGVKEFGKSTV